MPIFGLDTDGSSIREIDDIHMLDPDGSTVRRIREVHALDTNGSDVRKVFTKKDHFAISGTSNNVVSAVNEQYQLTVPTNFKGGKTAQTAGGSFVVSGSTGPATSTTTSSAGGGSWVYDNNSYGHITHGGSSNGSYSKLTEDHPLSSLSTVSCGPNSVISHSGYIQINGANGTFGNWTTSIWLIAPPSGDRYRRYAGTWYLASNYGGTNTGNPTALGATFIGSFSSGSGNSGTFSGSVTCPSNLPVANYQMISQTILVGSWVTYFPNTYGTTKPSASATAYTTTSTVNNTASSYSLTVAGNSITGNLAFSANNSTIATAIASAINSVSGLSASASSNTVNWTSTASSDQTASGSINNHSNGGNASLGSYSNNAYSGGLTTFSFDIDTGNTVFSDSAVTGSFSSEASANTASSELATAITNASINGVTASASNNVVTVNTGQSTNIGGSITTVANGDGSDNGINTTIALSETDGVPAVPATVVRISIGGTNTDTSLTALSNADSVGSQLASAVTEATYDSSTDILTVQHKDDVSVTITANANTLSITEQ